MLLICYTQTVGNYQANLDAHRPGISTAEMVKCYDDWVSRGTYELVKAMPRLQSLSKETHH